MAGFWTGGDRALRSGFKKEVVRLQKELAEAISPEDKEELQSQLEQVKRQMKDLLGSSDRLLF